MGLFLAFFGPNDLLLGLGSGSKTVLGSTHVLEQLLFSIVPSIMTFDIYLSLGSFFPFWALKGYFWGRGRAQKLFWVSLYRLITFFLSFALFLLYHVVLSLCGWWVFPAITLSQPNYGYGCFVVRVVVVVGL